MSLITCPECKKEYSNTLTKCPHCGFKTPITKNVQAGCGVAAFAALLLVFLFFYCTSGNDSEATSQDDVAQSAFYTATEFVKGNLKAPSTAEFSNYYTDKTVVQTADQVHYDVRGYVDSQNSFGAQIRSNWSCKLRYEASSKTFFLEDIKIE